MVRASEDPWFKIMLKAEPAVSSEKVARGFIQLTLENHQGWRQQKLYEKPAPYLNCSHDEKVPPLMQSL